MRIKFTNLYKLAPNKKNIVSKINKLIKNSNFVGGKEVKILRKISQNLSKSKYCISLGNGTDALEIAINSLNIKKGAEIIVPCQYLDFYCRGSY